MLVLNLTFKCLASDNVPESCGYDREVMLEALTGMCECQVLSPDKIHPDVHAVEVRAWGQHFCNRNGEIAKDLAGSVTLSERTEDNLRPLNPYESPTDSHINVQVDDRTRVALYGIAGTISLEIVFGIIRILMTWK